MKKQTKKSFRLLTLLLILTLFSGCAKAEFDKAEDHVGNSKPNSNSGWYDDSVKEEVDMEVSTDTPELDNLKENDLSNRKIIKRVNLHMQTEQFDSLKNDLESTISSFGGYVESSDFYAPHSSSNRSYSLTARIPAEYLDKFITTIGDIGTIVYKTETKEDVTLSYVDKTAYKEALEVEYDRVLDLLKQAEDIEQILILESKLSDLRYQINSYESQLRTYDDLISYSTVTIDINEVRRVEEVSDSFGSRIKNGFMNSLYSIADFFVELFISIISNLPVILIWAIVLTAIFLFIKKLFRKVFGKMSTKKKRSKITMEHEDDITQE